MYDIPLFELNFDENEINAVIETIHSKWISMGPKCEDLEKRFAEMLEVEHAVSLDNCTNALHLAMILCDIQAGDEVLCPSLTFAASVNCIRYTGAIPVFCDIRAADDLNIDPGEIEKKITPRTKAIVVVHLAGFPADMDKIMDIAKRNKLYVIEDACHGPLSEYKNKKIGAIGDIGCFSFFSNKNISTGEGGMLITNNKSFNERARLLRSHGMTTMSYQRATGHATTYDIIELGYNFRMDDIRASIAIAQLQKLSEDIKRRIWIRKKYIEYLSDIKNIIIPFKNNHELVSNYIMPIVLSDSTREKRESVRDYLHKKGIQTSIHYPAVHRFSIYKAFKLVLPITEYVSDNEITLPMYANLSTEKLVHIASTLRECV
jgi:dTDP-4-amino-4,6-dideoxygalactose transaminase